MAEVSSGQFRSVSLTQITMIVLKPSLYPYRGRRHIYSLIQLIEVPRPENPTPGKCQQPGWKRREKQEMSCRELMQKTKEIAKIVS